MGRRLFERLQKGIETVPRQHMHLVNEVDLVPTLGRCILDVIQNFAGIVDSGSRCGIDFDEINAPPLVYALAGAALTARFGLLTLLTVDRFCQYPGKRRLADATCTAEKIGMMYPGLLKRIAQGINNMILSHALGKTTGPPHSGEGLGAHGRAGGVIIR